MFQPQLTAADTKELNALKNCKRNQKSITAMNFYLDNKLPTSTGNKIFFMEQNIFVSKTKYF